MASGYPTSILGESEKMQKLINLMMCRVQKQNSYKPFNLHDIFFSVISWLLLSLPFALYLFYIFQYSVDVPLSDDYDAVLGFMNSFLQTENFGKKLGLLFAQHNEHRIVFDRIVFLVQYFIFGKTNFKHLILFGNAGWILTVLILVFQQKKELNLPLIYLLPVPYILLAFVHWTNMFFAMASIQNYWFILFSVLFLLCLTKNRLVGACLLFPVALFTSGGGVVLYPLGNIYWLLQKRRRHLIIFFISSTTLMLTYFYGYHTPSQHPSIIGSFNNLEQTIIYFFALWGGMIPSRELALLTGFTSFALSIAFAIKRTESDFICLMLGLVSLIAVTASLARSGFGVEQAIESKYTMYSLLAWACTYLLIIVSVKNSNILAKRVLLVTLTLSVLFSSGFLLKYEASSFFVQLQIERTNSLVAFIKHKDRVAQILLTSEELGIYEYKDVPLYSPDELYSDEFHPNSDFSGSIDVYNGSYIAGWALIPAMNAANSNIFILLTDGARTFKLKTLRVFRPDVSRAHNNMFQHEVSGYQSFIDSYEIPPGSYRLGILVENGDKRAVTWSDKVFVVP